MQVKNITNSQLNLQNFQGRIDIIPGDLSYEPAKYVRKAYNSLTELIKDKPYNLYIRQNHKNHNVKLILQKEDSFIKDKGFKAEGCISDDADLYEALTKHLINIYEEKSQIPHKHLWKKIKTKIKAAFNKK